MKKFSHQVCFVLLLLLCTNAFSQEQKFFLALDDKVTSLGRIEGITQDLLGRIWLITSEKGLYQYDGKKLTAFKPDDENPNSIMRGYLTSICVDSSGFIWISSFDNGLARFDPIANSFQRFRHNAKDPSSISNDSIFSTLTDRMGNVWIGTYRGLDMYDRKSGKFIHYKLDSNYQVKGFDFENIIFVIYEDKQGTIWIGSGLPFGGRKDGPGRLYRLDRTTRKLIHYKHDPNDPGSLSNNNISAIYEDSKGVFWVGTRGNGLHSMDRKTGKFTHYAYDSLNPGKLSRPPIIKNQPDFVTFIAEDGIGKLWIGSDQGGINYYDPGTKKLVHYGKVIADKTDRFAKDTLTGFKAGGAFRAFQSKDGIMWFTATNPDGLYKLNLSKTTIPHFELYGKSGARTFYHDAATNALWVGTDTGLVRRDLSTQKDRIIRFDTKKNDPNDIRAIRADPDGSLWLASHNYGLHKFHPKTETFIHYRQDSTNSRSLISDEMHCLFFDHEKMLWAGTHYGLTVMNTKTGSFTNYRNDSKDSTTIGPGAINGIIETKDFSIWVAGSNGVDRLDRATNKFRRYSIRSYTTCIYLDANGKIWAGCNNGLFQYDPAKDIFKNFTSPNFPAGIENVQGIIEDDKNNLWITTNNSIIRINKDRTGLKVFRESSGIRPNTAGWMDNYRSKDGQLFFETDNGYYAFHPDKLVEAGSRILLQVTGLRIDDKEIVMGENEVLKAPISNVEELVLRHNQNTFSFDFNATDYESTGEIKYLFRLENYESSWHEISGDRKASFFNIPEGKYIFRVKAVNNEGDIAEKSIRIIITPPWWKTWWAYTLYILLAIIVGYLIVRYYKNHVLKRERERAQQKELAQAREIEKAYNELKTTQQQLIQSEKMASLGELTAGIAHEIQNPLNFVNNFSDVNTELIEELKSEKSKPKSERNEKLEEELLNDIEQNLEKINHHGKRADAIVKGMLQHSRNNSGQKELTDINALCDEYLRLAYHGLRAKDKSFNATTRTEFDNSIGKINIIPQDIGRVVLNLINNAFYAVNEKRKENLNGYDPSVAISTFINNGKVEIKVKDNGNGIPDSIKEKIFQPFFTTKPTGQGTGLGLSLAYDIVKAHGGTISVHSEAGKGSEFRLQLNC